MYVINTKGFKPNDVLQFQEIIYYLNCMITFLFSKDDIEFSDETMLYIIEKHTNKDEGVRNLKII